LQMQITAHLLDSFYHFRELLLIKALIIIIFVSVH
jgi:hypothetical protein